MTKEVVLGNGGVALVSDEDFERVSRLRWRRWVGPGEIPYVIWRSKKNQRTVEVRLHRFILGLKKGEPMVDHANGDTFDNRRDNLRVCTAQQNIANKKPSTSNKSGFKGVWWRKAKRKWVASIKISGKQIWLGSYAIKADAARAYNLAAVKFFGEFARLNIIAN